MSNGVYDYLNLDNRIEELEKRKSAIHQSLYARSWNTRIEYDELSIHTTAPRVESVVSDFVETLEIIDKRLERLRKRRKYFKAFLNELPPKARIKLLNGIISEGLKTRVNQEIQEIELAISYEFGYRESDIELEDDFFTNIKIMAEVFG